MHLPSNPELHLPTSEGQIAQDVATSSLARHEFPYNQPGKQVDYVNGNSIPSNLMSDFSTIDYIHPLGPVNEARLSTEKSEHKGPPAMVYNPPYQPGFDDVTGLQDTQSNYQDQDLWLYALLLDGTWDLDSSHFSHLEQLSAAEGQNTGPHLQAYHLSNPFYPSFSYQSNEITKDFVPPISLSAVDQVRQLGPSVGDRLPIREPEHSESLSQAHNPAYHTTSNDFTQLLDSQYNYEFENIFPHTLLQPSTTTLDLSHSKSGNTFFSPDIQNSGRQACDTPYPPALGESFDLAKYSASFDNPERNHLLERHDTPDYGADDYWTFRISDHISEEQRKQIRKGNPLQVSSQVVESAPSNSWLSNVEGNQKLDNLLSYGNTLKNNRFSSLSSSIPKKRKREDKSAEFSQEEELGVVTGRFEVDKPLILGDNPSSEDQEKARKNNFFAHISTLSRIHFLNVPENFGRKERLYLTVDSFYQKWITRAQHELSITMIMKLSRSRDKKRVEKIKKLIYGLIFLNYRILAVLGGDEFDLVLAELENFFQYLTNWFDENPDMMKAIFLNNKESKDNRRRTLSHDIQENILHYLNAKIDPLRFRFLQKGRVIEVHESKVLASKISVKVIWNYYCTEKRSKIFLAIFENEYNFSLFLRKIKSTLYTSRFQEFMKRRKQTFQNIKILPWGTTVFQAEEFVKFREHLTNIGAYKRRE
ncbi:hypothetical protein O181_033686 [Austropuccinia psidii MF-1]|uniref:Uncharacterized protein n=1 Tax=Austropuccinia psidii MF-1 TaxID=1389203 RepID=A0A9Q3D4W9_9BASI|nr:hypothetical protein [Austropuccinia psidii MF-1]